MKRTLGWLLLLPLLLTSCQQVNLDAPIPSFETGVDPTAWATIPAGEFLSGQFEEESFIDYDFDIMVTDVTCSQYAAYLNSAMTENSVAISMDRVSGFYPGEDFDGGRHEEEVPAGDYIFIPLDDPALRLQFQGDAFSVKSGWDDHPMTMVSWFGAKAYCEYYGWRLPTEMEWEKAARGTDGRPFPWGSEINIHLANYISSRDPFENMKTFGSRTTPVGFYNGNTYAGFETFDSANQYGLYDMAGNVWQWMADDYPNQHYRYQRGGSMNQYPNKLRIWSRNSASPTFTSPAVGFRCVRESGGAR